MGLKLYVIHGFAQCVVVGYEGFSVANIVPDKLDFKILAILQEDPDISVRELSRKLRVPKSTVYYRLKTLEQSGYFKRAVIVNTEKLGFEYPVVLLVRVKHGSNHYKRLRDILVENPYVQLVYNVMGGFDFVAVGKFPDRNRYMQLVDSVLDTGVAKVYAMVIARTYKESLNVPLVHLVEA